MAKIGVLPNDLSTTLDAPLSLSSTSSGSSSWWSNGPSRGGKLVSKQGSTSLQMQRTMLDESILGDINLLTRRPERICLIFSRSSPEQTKDLSFRMGLEGSILVDDIRGRSVLDVQSPTTKSFYDAKDASCGNLIQVGDVIESINGFDCRGKTVSEVTRHWEDLTGDICLTLSTQDGTGHAGLCQLVLMQSNKSDINVTPSEIDPSGEQEISSLPDLGLQLTQRQGMLQVRGFSSQSCLTKLGGTMIASGDFVVSMATTVCAALDAKEAHLLWQMQTETSPDCLSLLTIQATESQRRWSRLRKAAVAVGGGTLVGIGSIMLVTPLHPVGHAMTLGGVGVLGTEFEAPKRALQAAKDKFRRKESTPVPPL
jgi:hypothetical protein